MFRFRKSKKSDQTVAQPIGTATVTTPASPQKPKGYLWDQLESTSNLTSLRALRDHAKAHGYSLTGQLMTAINNKIESLGGGR